MIVEKSDRRQHRASSVLLGLVVAVLGLASMLSFSSTADAHLGNRSHSQNPNIAADVGETWCGQNCRLFSVRDVQRDGHCAYLTKHGQYVQGSWSCGSLRWVVLSSRSGVEVCISGHWRCDPVKID